MKAPLLLADFVAALMAEFRRLVAHECVYVDQNSAPCPRDLYVRAAKRRAFPIHRIGRSMVARRDDVIAWIESHDSASVSSGAPMPAATPSEPTVRESLADRWGVMLVEGAKR